MPGARKCCPTLTLVFAVGWLAGNRTLTMDDSPGAGAALVSASAEARAKIEVMNFMIAIRSLIAKKIVCSDDCADVG